MPYGTLGQLVGGRPTGRSGPFIPPVEKPVPQRQPRSPWDEAGMFPNLNRGFSPINEGPGFRQGEGYQNWLMGHRGGGMRNRTPQTGQMQQAPPPRNPFMPTPGTGFPGPMGGPGSADIYTPEGGGGVAGLPPGMQFPQRGPMQIPGGGYTGGQPWQQDRTGGMAPWMGQQLPMQPPQAGNMSPWQGGIERFRRRSQF